MNKFLELFVGIVVYVLVLIYLVPLLPKPFDLITQIFLVVIAIVWLVDNVIKIKRD